MMLITKLERIGELPMVVDALRVMFKDRRCKAARPGLQSWLRVMRACVGVCMIPRFSICHCGCKHELLACIIFRNLSCCCT